MDFDRRVFCGKRGMANIRDKRLCSSKSPIRDFFIIFTRYIRNMYNNVVFPPKHKDSSVMDKTIAEPLKKNKMAEGKLVWIVGSFLGIPALLLSMFVNLPEPFKTALSVIATLYALAMTIKLVVNVLGSIEDYRAKRISNNERVRNLRRRHQLQDNA